MVIDGQCIVRRSARCPQSVCLLSLGASGENTCNEVLFFHVCSECIPTGTISSRKEAGNWLENLRASQSTPGCCRASVRKLSNIFIALVTKNIHLFDGRAVKRERRKGSSRRQQPAYGAAVNEVARELLRSVRSPKRENGGRRYIKHDGMIASPVGSCLCC